MCCDAHFIPLLALTVVTFTRLLNTRQQLTPLHQFDVPHSMCGTLLRLRLLTDAYDFVTAHCHTKIDWC